jgi:large subunit ribosomal protein L35
MKAKTHSGAKKRMRVLPSGKVKRKKVGRRHRLISENHNPKRHLAKGTYVHSANMLQTSRLLLIKVGG